jgi:PUA-domain protein
LEADACLRRYHLSKKEKKTLQRLVREKYGIELDTDNIEVVINNDVKMYLVDGKPGFIEGDDTIIPHLKWLLSHGHCFLPKIVVDMGAVKPVSKGARVMAPGIVRIIGDFKKNDYAVIIDEKYEAPLAIVKVLYSSDELRQIKRGPVAESIHHIGDMYWSLVN